MKNVYLKPCPFCKETVIFSHEIGGVFYYECSNNDCGARSAERFTDSDAVVAWNTRPIEESLAEDIHLFRMLLDITYRYHGVESNEN